MGKRKKIRFMTKAELGQELGLHREALRVRLKEVKGLKTGNRQILYPHEVRMIYEVFGVY